MQLQQMPPQTPVPPKLNSSKDLKVFIGVLLTIIVFAGGMTTLLLSQNNKAGLHGGATSPDPVLNARADDTNRRVKINAIYSKLEEYYNYNGFYPLAVDTTILKGIDAASLTDLNGNSIHIVKVATETEAMAVPITNQDDQLQYIPYSCTSDGCSKYLLRGYIAYPNETIRNPIEKVSLN